MDNTHDDVSETDDASIEKEIDIFREKIYTLTPYNDTGLYFASDYYTEKEHIDKRTSSRNTIFSLDTNSKTLNNYNLRECESRQKEVYAEFQTHSIELTGKTPSEIDAAHMELLRKRVIRKLVNIPTREQISEREDAHRAALATEIQIFLNEISPKLYATAEEGHNCVSWDFKHVNERFLTNYGKLPQITGAPCLDGKLRTFTEYVYYLAEKLFVRHADETDNVLWFSQRLCERVRKLFPHLTVEAGPVGAILPSMRVYFAVDHTALVH